MAPSSPLKALKPLSANSANIPPPALTPGKKFTQKRLHVDLGDYLQYFRTNSIEVPTETLSYYQVLPLWMNLDSNIDNLCVGSSLQRTDVSNGFYPFIKSLYAEAKRCLLGQRRDGVDGDGDGDVEFGEVGEVEEVGEDGDFRMAKVLVLTAGKTYMFL